jgi:hypothetical protein
MLVFLTLLCITETDIMKSRNTTAEMKFMERTSKYIKIEIKKKQNSLDEVKTE